MHFNCIIVSKGNYENLGYCILYVFFIKIVTLPFMLKIVDLLLWKNTIYTFELQFTFDIR